MNDVRRPEYVANSPQALSAGHAAFLKVQSHFLVVASPITLLNHPTNPSKWIFI